MSTVERGDETAPHVLLTDEDATDDESGERIQPNSQLAVARPGLYVGTSKVIGWWGGGGLGLFSSEPLHAGDLLGYYTGIWQTTGEYESLPAARRRRLDEYAVSVTPKVGSGDGDQMVVSPPIEELGFRPDPALYPMAFANEATKPLRPNAAFVRVQLNADDVGGDIPLDEVDGEWLGLAVYACKDIGRHQEVLVHYGDTFPHDKYRYEAGEPCEPPEVTESPIVLGAVPLSALAFVRGSASDVEDSSDPEYATDANANTNALRLDAETDVPWSAEKIERFARLHMAALDVKDPREWEEGMTRIIDRLTEPILRWAATCEREAAQVQTA